MSSPTGMSSVQAVPRLAGFARWSVGGLLLAAIGMLLQIASGSTLYPSVTGPIVLTVTALAVAFRPGFWTRLVGVVVPLVLGVGAIVAAVLTGEFVDQLTNPGNPGILLGSVAHVAGLTAAVANGIPMVMGARSAAGSWR